jgi:hypothetical protein
MQALMVRYAAPAFWRVHAGETAERSPVLAG